MRSADSVRARLRLPTPSLRRDGEEGAHVARLEREELLHVGQAIEMRSEEGEELAEIPLIGLRGLGGELALGADIGEPILDRLAHVRRSHISRG